MEDSRFWLNVLSGVGGLLALLILVGGGCSAQYKQKATELALAGKDPMEIRCLLNTMVETSVCMVYSSGR